MSFFAKHKKLSYILLILGALTLLLSPIFYLILYSPTEFGEEITCNAEIKEKYRQTSLKEIAPIADEWEDVRVYVRGNITYAPTSQIYILNDGMPLLSLDTSACKNMEIFNDGEALVAVFGTVRSGDNGHVLVIDDIFESVPAPVIKTFNAGVYIFLFLLALPFGFLANKIRIKRGWDPNSEREIKRQSRGPLLFGMFGSILWFVNPIIGALVFVYGLVTAKKFWGGPYQRIAFIGVAICLIGLLGFSILTASGKITFDQGADFFTSFEYWIGPGANESFSNSE